MNTTIKVFYWANNRVSPQAIKELSEEALCNAEHFTSKYVNAKGTNGTEKFFNWFMQLSNDNKKSVVDWIDNNYQQTSIENKISNAIDILDTIELEEVQKVRDDLADYYNNLTENYSNEIHGY